MSITIKNNIRASKKKKSSQKKKIKQVLSDLKNELTNEFLIFYESSINDFYKLEETKADYYQGFTVMNSPASFKHENTFADLFSSMRIYSENKKLGKVLGSRTLIIFDGKNRFEPDIVFISKDNPGEFKDVEFIGVPDLVVEILSKTSRQYDLILKNMIYQEHKVKEIIFVDLKNTEIIIFTLEKDDYKKIILRQNEEYISNVINGFVFSNNLTL